MLKKIYAVRKLIRATSVQDALRKEKKSPVDEVYVYEIDRTEMGYKKR